jgi:putative hydrolase of the HAD superfamily
MVVQTVVFDLFRTLVDPEAFHPTAYKRTDRMAAVLGVDPNGLAQWWIDTKRERNISRIPTLEDRLQEYFQSTLDQTKSRSLIDQAVYEGDRYHYEALLNPHDVVIRVLTELRERKIKIGVLSNCDEDEMRCFPQSPLVKLVDAISLSIDTGFMKPEPAAFHDVLKKLGSVEPRDAIFVGDGESQELTGAKTLGFGRVIFLRQFVANTGFHSKEKLAEFTKAADRTIDSILDVTSYF